MSSDNLNVYMPVLMLIGFAVLMVFGALCVGRFLRPHKPGKLKESPYECGEEPVGSAWSNFKRALLCGFLDLYYLRCRGGLDVSLGGGL